ncbi:MAG: S9 family peptidase [Thermoplasmata archaeon]
MRALSVEDLFAGIDIQGFDVHPDGKRAICCVNRGENWELGMLDLVNGRMRRFLTADQSLTEPVFSPDGRTIAYQTDFQGDENHDIVTVTVDGKRIKKVTDGVEDNARPRFSPDGRWIAFVSNRQKDIENLYIVSSSGGKVIQLSNEPVPVRGIAWSPDGTKIAYHTGIYEEDYISIADVERRKTKRILSRRNVEYMIGGEYGPENPWSPDGRSILFMSNEHDPFDIGELDLATRRTRWVVRSPHDKYSPQWSPDGKALAYLEVDDPNLVVKVLRGKNTRVVSPPDGFSRQMRWSPDGRYVYFVNGCATRQDELYRAVLRPRKVSRLHTKRFPPRSLAYPALVKFPSFDGRKIPAMLFSPKDRSRRAGIVMPHGGPDMQSLNEWDPLPQMLVDRGFYVIAPNYRGSTGYGREFWQLHNHDLGGGDFLDTVYAGKYLVDSGLVARDRLGYWGASYSGFTCMLALTKFPDMWAAGVSIVGFFDWKTEIESERGFLRAYDLRKMGDPRKNREFFRERSPLYFLEHLKAPLLMTASCQDVRCPPEQSRMVVERLRKLGKVFEYHEYTDEGHWPRKRKNLIDLYKRSTDFLDRHIPK